MVPRVRMGEPRRDHQPVLGEGSKVFVEGRIKPIRIYETQGGEAKADLEINAQDVRFLSPRDSNGGNGNGYDAREPVGAAQGQNARPSAPQGRQVDDDDLPW